MTPRSALLFAALAFAACGDDGPTKVELDPEVQAQVDAAAERREVDLERERDNRVRLLMQSVDLSNGHYDRDTGDPLAILIDKLEFSATEVLHRTKSDLANLGALAVPELDKLISRYFEDPGGGARLQNAIDVLGLMQAPAAHPPLVRCLDHPRDTIRASALRALARGSALPEDFDRLLIHVETEREHTRESAALALTVADPTRAAAQFMDWLEAGTHGDLYGVMSNKVAAADASVVGDRASALAPSIPPQLGLSLAVLGLRTGDERAVAVVQSGLAAEDPAQRAAASVALVQAGRGAAVVELVVADPAPLVRTILITELAAQVDAGQLEASPELIAALHGALDAISPDVRKVALGALVRWRDPVAIDRALAMLDADRITMQETLTVLMTAMHDDPALSERVLAELLGLDAAQDHRPLAERLAILQGIGQVPDVAAAQHLWKLARAESGTEAKLQGLRAHRWLLTQASNTSDEGRAWLGNQLEEVTAYPERLDVIWAASAQRTDASRDFLIDFLESDPDPYEALFAGERLAQLGPAALVAPVLKRVALRVDHGRVRAAFDAMLWRWY